MTTPKSMSKPVRVVINVAIALAVVLIGFLGYVATRPDAFHVERSAQIEAPPEVVFSIVNNLHRWNEWSPYDKYDLKMKKTVEGPESGPGATYAWDGDDNVGSGKMTIESSQPNSLVTMKLEFFRPFTGTNKVDFKLEPVDAGTRVSWIMDGKYNFVSKIFCVFMNMDQMVGKDFEDGLSSLNTLAKSETNKAGSQTESKVGESDSGASDQGGNVDAP